MSAGKKLRSCHWVLILAANLLGASRAQVILVDFEAPQWPTANTSYLYTTPSNWNWSVQAAGTTLAFELRNIGLWGNESNDANATYFGKQAARCRFPQATIGVTGPSLLAARGVVDPRGIAFKLASTGLSTVLSDPRHWVLEFWSVGISGAAAGQQSFHKSWSSLRGDLDLGRYYVRESVDLSRLPSGTYDLEWRVTQHADSGVAFEVLIDDIEVYLGSSSVPPAPMPLDLLEPLLNAEPAQAAPDSQNKQRRSWMIRDLDRHAAAYHSDFYLQGNLSTSTAFTEYFRARTRKVIAEIKSLHPAADEVLIWKLYSSGYVIKTPQYTFGYDVQEGPNNQGFVSSASRGIAMGLTDDDADELAASLDFTLHTHYHHDHLNYAFVSRMIAAGKKVYGPAELNPGDPLDLREFYSMYGSGVHVQDVAKIEDPHSVHPRVRRLPEFDINVCTYRAFQSSSMMLAPVGPIPAPLPVDPVNYSYHLTTDNGISFLFMGDVRQVLSSSPAVAALDPVLDWFSELKNLGLRVDMKLGAGPLIDTNVWRSVLLENFKPLIRLHGHEWEMNHPSINLLTRSWGDAPLTDESVFPLSVGECFRYSHFPQKPVIVSSTLNSTSVEITATTTHTVRITVSYGTAADFARGIYPLAVTSSVPSRVHQVSLTGLDPGTTYYFYVTIENNGPGSGFLDSDQRFTTTRTTPVSGQP